MRDGTSAPSPRRSSRPSTASRTSTAHDPTCGDTLRRSSAAIATSIPATTARTSDASGRTSSHQDDRSMMGTPEDVKARVEQAYNAASDFYDHEANSFRSE